MGGFRFGCLYNPDVPWVDFNLELLGWKGLAWLCSGGWCERGSSWRDVAALLLDLGLGKASVGYGGNIDAVDGILLPKVGCSGGNSTFQPQCFPSRRSLTES